MSDGESTNIGNSSNNTKMGRKLMSHQGMGQMNSGESVARGSNMGGT
jgi:hypothetical protein